MPKVALIIPCYNQAQYLSECLDGLLCQTFSDWTAIVVDDGSPDNTREVADKYIAQNRRITYIRQENQGLAGARNAGIRNTASQYILPLDADDIIHPDYLAKTIPILESQPDIKVVYTRCRYFGSVEQEMLIQPFSFHKLLHGNIFPATALYRRCDYISTPGYDPHLCHGWEDWDFWLSLLGPKDNVYKVDEILFFYRRKHDSMITRMEDDLKREIARHRIFLNHKELYNEYFNDPLNLYNRIKRLEKEIKVLQKKDILGRISGWLKRNVGSSKNLTSKGHL